MPPSAPDRAIDDDIEKISDIGIIVPAAFEKALMQGLAVQPKNRIQTIEELKELLENSTNEDELKEDNTASENVFEDEVQEEPEKPINKEEIKNSVQPVNAVRLTELYVNRPKSDDVDNYKERIPKQKTPSQDKPQAKKSFSKLQIGIIAAAFISITVGTVGLLTFLNRDKSISKLSSSVQDIGSQPASLSSTQDQEENNLIESNNEGTSSENSSVQNSNKSSILNPSSSFKTIDTDGLTCKSAILVDAQTDEIIAGLDYDKKLYPAGLTNLLTVLVAAENIEDLNTTYTFTSEDISNLEENNAPMVGFEPGETVTAKDLMYGVITMSGQDAVIGLVNIVSGSEEEFVNLMNQKSEELCLIDTNIINSNGSYNEMQYSTAQDIAVLTKACLENNICREMITAESYITSNTDKHSSGIELMSIFHSRFNGLYIDMDQDEKADADIIGGKTGYSEEAQYTLVSIVSIDGYKYICVNLKSNNAESASFDAVTVFEKYLPKTDSNNETTENSENSSDILTNEQESSNQIQESLSQAQENSSQIQETLNDSQASSNEDVYSYPDSQEARSNDNSEATEPIENNNSDGSNYESQAYEAAKIYMSGSLVSSQFREQDEYYVHYYFFTNDGDEHGYSVAYNKETGQAIVAQAY